MKDIVIYGAGGFGRETLLLLAQINLSSPQWNVLGFCDDGKLKDEEIDRFSVLGGMQFLNDSKKELNVVIAIADPVVRKKIKEQLNNSQLRFPALVHPDVFVNEDCTISEGCIICSGVKLTKTIHINSFVIINLSCTIGHDCLIDNFSSLMPAVNISGNVNIGQGVYVGVGAILLQGIIIGDNSIIGAGAVVTKSFDNNKRIMGVPARSI